MIESSPFAGYTTPETVAAATDGEVSAETVRRMCREGRFPRAVKVGRSWVIPEDDAIVFLRNYERYQSGDQKFQAPPPSPGAAPVSTDDKSGE